MDPRHAKRVKIVQNIFAHMFQGYKASLPPNKDYEEAVSQILSHIQALDEIISKHAPKYPIDKIAKIDLSILRLAVYEIIFEKKEPEKVVINEAVELAKELGNERSYAFVNAVLGSILKDIPL
jgi:transcription antitermination protein NusB